MTEETRDRYGEALGIWNVKIGGANLDLKPMLGDGRKMRDLLVDGKYRKNRSLMFAAFETLMFDFIKRQYSDDGDDRIKEYIDINTMELFKEAQLRFRLTTKEEMESAEKDTKEELKKLIGEA